MRVLQMHCFVVLLEVCLITNMHSLYATIVIWFLSHIYSSIPVYYFITLIMVALRVGSAALLCMALMLSNAEGVTASSEAVSNTGDLPCVTENSDQSIHLFNAVVSDIRSNSIVNIKGDVVLSIKVTLRGLTNIIIIGQGNPTVSCNGTGAVKFVSCTNVTVEGINWDRCGSNNEKSAYPGIEFQFTSNIVITRCSFCHSIGQGVVLSKVFGNVFINNCSFTNNNEFDGDGVAIYYSTKTKDHFGLQMIINNCNFSYNGNFQYNRNAHSVVYIDSLISNSHEYISIQNSVFSHNQGAPLYISNTALYCEGAVLFEHNMATNGAAIFSTNSTIVLESNSTFSFSNNFVNASGGALFLNHSKVYFKDNTVTRFRNNSAQSHGGALALSRSIVSFCEHSVVILQDNKAGIRGGALYCETSSALFKGNSIASFNKNNANFGGAICSSSYSVLLFSDSSAVTFADNTVKYGGGAIFSRDHSLISFDGSSLVTFKDNSANKNGGSINSQSNSVIMFNNNSMMTFLNNKAVNGGAVYSSFYSNTLFCEYTNVLFVSNVASDAGAMWSSHYSNVSCDGKSTVRFTGNYARANGGACRFYDNSHVTFTKYSQVIFNVNNAGNAGGAVSADTHCNVLFDGNSNVMFTHNRARLGGAMYFGVHTDTVFDTNATVTFISNIADELGGGVNLVHDCNFSFAGSSLVTFANNSADFGGGIRLVDNCNIKFDKNSKVIFHDIIVRTNGGALLASTHSNVMFDNNTTVTFINNQAHLLGGGIHISMSSFASFDGHSVVTFSTNTALYGGALFASEHCEILFRGKNTVVMFNSNSASYGGAMHSEYSSGITFNGYTTVSYGGNKASKLGGAIASFEDSSIRFDGNSNVTFTDNSAPSSGAVHSEQHSTMLYNGSTSVTYNGNHASKYGGAVCSYKNCSIVFHGNSLVSFIDNKASSGGAMFSQGDSNTLFKGNTVVKFKGNKASRTGGAINFYTNCSLVFEESSMVTLDDNVAIEGGAILCNELSHMLFKGTTNVSLNSNQAMDGGAVHIQQSRVVFATHSAVKFDRNLAGRSGGAMYLKNNFTITFENESQITFYQNNATLHGGAIYGDLNQTNHSKIFSYATCINFDSNVALIGDDVYVQASSLCDETCLNSSVIGLAVAHNNPLHHLALYAPATCLDATKPNDNCGTYFVPNIMLGQDIKIDACALSFYDQPAGAVDFVVSGRSQHHHLDGTTFVPIACKQFEGISVLGQEISDISSVNFSMTITSYTNSEVEVSVGLVIELSPCHPGFVYDNDTQRCMCYGDRVIISCFGSTSYIKGGYWFGKIDGKSTVTDCPNNYCNFTCCETTNGFYQLSPVRTSQCSSHRSGSACGSCEQDYTLSFDSSECISISKCTTGQTVLVVTLSMIYWIVLVVVVFIVTYYQTGIGYLYAITYYYSMLDILLNQNLYASQGLFTAVSVMSSIAKITPQFLGQLCLVQNMSGIDQQFIHYIHPLAVTIIVAVICLLARMSYKFSAFVSKGIIRVICFLLLLSYTSVATTSLLLLRSLTFDNTNKVYTYLSPNIEYCHGRHLPYFIVAVLCTIVIVFGLPLLLLLEPYLNQKINFTRLKPLLDQFQGCYKDKHRSFAAFYMICRVLVILIILVSSTNSYTSLVSLLAITTLFSLIHLLVKPYRTKILNIFDGVVLHTMIFAAVISLFNNIGSGMLSTVIIILVILPLMVFAVMQLVVNKEMMKRSVSCCKSKPNVNKDNNDTPPISCNGIAIIIDDRMRKNATICEM